ELVEVRFQAPRGDVVGAHHDRDARYPGPLAAADGERVDVEAAAAEERDDAVQRAGPVLDVDDQRLRDAAALGDGERRGVARESSPSNCGRRIMSPRSVFAGTIG